MNSSTMTHVNKTQYGNTTYNKGGVEVENKSQVYIYIVFAILALVLVSAAALMISRVRGWKNRVGRRKKLESSYYGVYGV